MIPKPFTVHVIGFVLGFWWFGPWFIVPALLLRYYKFDTGLGVRIGRTS